MHIYYCIFYDDDDGCLVMMIMITARSRSARNRVHFDMHLCYCVFYDEDDECQVMMIMPTKLHRYSQRGALNTLVRFWPRITALLSWQNIVVQERFFIFPLEMLTHSAHSGDE